MQIAYAVVVTSQVAIFLTFIVQHPTPRTAAASEALVGKPAPPVSLALVDGKHFNLADHRGKVVLLAFWATWCEPCRRDLPLLLHAEANTRDLFVAGVTTEPRADVVAYLKQQNFTNFRAALDPDEKVSKAYGIDLVPRLFVIDQQGIVRKMIRGLPSESVITKVIQQLVP